MNDDNLKGYGFHERTASEQRELAKMGGEASGRSRKEKADFRRTLNKLLTTPIDSPDWTPLLKALGLPSTLESVICMAIIKKGIQTGDSKVFETIAKYAGQSDKTDIEREEQQLRVKKEKLTQEAASKKQTEKDEDPMTRAIKEMLGGSK